MSAQGELTDLLSFALLSPCLLLTPLDTHTHTCAHRWRHTDTYRKKNRWKKTLAHMDEALLQEGRIPNIFAIGT